jgi:hypothetical protein
MHQYMITVTMPPDVMLAPAGRVFQVWNFGQMAEIIFPKKPPAFIREIGWKVVDTLTVNLWNN